VLAEFVDLEDVRWLCSEDVSVEPMEGSWELLTG
jgi:hypothetical protein